MYTLHSKFVVSMMKLKNPSPKIVSNITKGTVFHEADAKGKYYIMSPEEELQV